MRTFGTILALLLIFFGLIAAGLVAVRIWQDNGVVRMNIDTATLNTPAANGEPLVAAAEQAAAPELLLGVESGGMLLVTPEVVVALAAPADAPPADSAPVATLPPLVIPTLDPCPPAPADGFAADTAVVAVGMLRIYSAADVLSPALGELSAGQGLWILAGEDGRTAIKRCDVIWQRVRTADGLVGWVLADAVDVVIPTILPTLMPPPLSTTCPSGCAQPGCVQQPCPAPCYQPCPTPCYQPCQNQNQCSPPCPQPCPAPCGGVYSQ